MRQLLSDGIDDYRTFRISNGYKDNTLRGERTVLRILLTAVGNIYIDNIESRHVTRYFEIAARTRGPATLNIDHTVLSGFFKWARGTKRLPLDSDPLFARRRPKATKKEMFRLHVSKFGHLLDVAENRDPRNRALVAVFLYTLIRDQEATDLRICDLDLDAGTLLVRVKKSHTEDQMPISTELDRELRAWLTIYTQAVGPLQPNHYLLPRRTPTGIIHDGRGQIQSHTIIYDPELPIFRSGRPVSQALRDAGVPEKGPAGEPLRHGAHTLRRSAARALFDAMAASGHDHALREVKETLHHASVTQTERYIGLVEDRLARDRTIRGNLMYPDAVADNTLRVAR